MTKCMDSETDEEEREFDKKSPSEATALWKIPNKHTSGALMLLLCCLMLFFFSSSCHLISFLIYSGEKCRHIKCVNNKDYFHFSSNCLRYICKSLQFQFLIFFDLLDQYRKLSLLTVIPILYIKNKKQRSNLNLHMLTFWSVILMGCITHLPINKNNIISFSRWIV